MELTGVERVSTLEVYTKNISNKVTTMSESQYDSVEIRYSKNEVSPCENYNNIKSTMHVKKQSEINQAFDEKGYYERVFESAQAIVEKYYNGGISDEEMVRDFNEICEEAKQYFIHIGYITANNKEEHSWIIENTYIYYQHALALKSVDMCNKKGADIAHDYEGEDDRNWVYYDAEYYYGTEHMQGVIDEAMKGITEKWGILPMDGDEMKKNSGIVKSEFTFNGVWNWEAKYAIALQHSNNTEIEINWKPEQEFKFFYQQTSEQLNFDVSLNSGNTSNMRSFLNMVKTIWVSRMRGNAIHITLTDYAKGKDVFELNVKNDNELYEPMSLYESLNKIVKKFSLFDLMEK